MFKTFLLITLFLCRVGFAQDATMMVLGGTGPTTQLQTVLDGISDMLSANKVKVKTT